MAILIDNPSNVIAAAPDAPVLIDYDTEVIAPMWDFWLPELASITKDGSDLISAVESQKTTGGQTLVQATAASQPLYVAAAINGRAAMRFARQTVGAPDRFLVSNFPASASLSWTKIVVIRTAADNNLRTSNIWSDAAGTNVHRMELAWSANDGDYFLCRLGAGLASSAKVVPRPAAGTWFLAMESFDHVLGKVAASIDGSAWNVAATGGVTVDEISTSIGALSDDGSTAGMNADLALIGLSPLALHLSANAAVLTDIKSFVRDLFDLTIA